MKFLTLLFALCLMALPLEAQHGGGGHGGGGGGGHGGGGGGGHGGGGGGGGFHGGGGGFHNAPMGGFHGNPGFHGGVQNPPVGGFRSKPGISGGFHNAPVGGFHGDRSHGGEFRGREFHDGFHGHGSRVVISPFFGFGFGFGDPFFPYYYPAPTYPAPVYVYPPNDDETNYAVSGQAQEVPPAPSVQEVPRTPSTAPTSQVPVVVVLKDGRRIEAPGYALVGTTLWILTPQNSTKIQLSDVDTEATRTANLERGIDVVIPVPVPSSR